MTTLTKPAQASISTPSGWTVLATFRGTTPGINRMLDAWYVAFTHADMCGLTYQTYTEASRDPNPLDALESVLPWLNRSGPSYLPADACAEISDAIASTYGPEA